MEPNTHTITTTPATPALERTQRIRELNDAFRTSGQPVQPPQGRKLITRGVHDLGPAAVAEIARRVMTFSTFEEANDPWGEHDFGAFDYGPYKIFWKIDYYDAAEHSGSPDPSDPEVTCRVLTVLLADEY
jgi:hypothetical protein